MILDPNNIKQELKEELRRESLESKLVIIDELKEKQMSLENQLHLMQEQFNEVRRQQQQY